MTITEASGAFVFTINRRGRPWFPFPDVVAAVVRYTPASGLSDTRSLWEMSTSNDTKQFGPLDLDDLGVRQFELQLFSCSPGQITNATVDSVNIYIPSAPSYTFRRCSHRAAKLSSRLTTVAPLILRKFLFHIAVGV